MYRMRSSLPIQFAAAISNLALSQSNQDDLGQEKKSFHGEKFYTFPSDRPNGMMTPLMAVTGYGEEYPDTSSSSPPPLKNLAKATVPIILERLGKEDIERHELVKPWEGETIHEVSLGEEDLELTLGNSTFKG